MSNDFSENLDILDHDDGAHALSLNRAVRDVVGSPDMLKRFVAVVAPPDCFASLVIGEFEFRSHLQAPRPGAFAAFAGAGMDQLTLELCQPA
jgi:hypothetical protein